MTPAQRTVVAAITKAREGVAYTAKDGAVCPVCGAKRLRAYKTMAWSGNVRIRYHKCVNPECVLCELGEGVKSLQVA